jgi:hypothetical protein
MWLLLSLWFNELLWLVWRSLIDLCVWSMGLEGAMPSEEGWGWSVAVMGEFGADEANWTLPTGRLRTSSIASGMSRRFYWAQESVFAVRIRCGRCRGVRKC